MIRRYVLAVLACVGLAAVSNGALAQQKSIKDQLTGAWTLLLDDSIKADGSQEPLFGPNPIGSLIINPNGRYSVQIMREVNRPQFASKNLNTGTAEEIRAALLGMIGHFGAYTVNENDKSITFLIEGSSFPNLQGIKQRWQIANITDDVLTLRLPAATSTNPAGGFVAVQVIWRKVK
jgi:lipocalin-like protein